MNKASILYVLKILMLFLLVSIVLDNIIFLGLNKLSDKVYSGQSIGKLNHFLKIKDSTDLIVFGSSRANHHVDPAQLSNNAFNMGVDGTKIAYSSTLISLLDSKQQTVLLHIDPHHAFDTDYQGDDISALTTKYNRNQKIRARTDNLKKNNPFQRIYRSLSYNGMVLGIIKNYASPKYNYKEYVGYDPITLSAEQKERFKKDIELGNASKTGCSDVYQINTVYDSSLDDIKSFCEANNKTLLVFTSPQYQDPCEDDNKVFKDVMRKKGIVYYDFTQYFGNNNSLELWRDKTHLSKLGAEKFTEHLKKILNEKEASPVEYSSWGYQK